MHQYGRKRGGWTEQLEIVFAWPAMPAWRGTVADDIASDDGLERHFNEMPLPWLERTIPGLRIAHVEAITFGGDAEADARRRLQIAERVLEERKPTPKQGRLL